MLLALALPVPAALGKGADERVRGSCGQGAKSERRVTAKDGALEPRFRVDAKRAEQSWRMVITQERRVVPRTAPRTAKNGSFRVQRTLRDLSGSDTVTVRASGPGGLACNASVTPWG